MKMEEMKDKICGYNKKTLVAVIVLLIIAGGAFFIGAKYEKSKLAKLGLLKSGKNEAVCKTNDSIAGEITVKTDTTVTIKTSDGNTQDISLASIKPSKKNTPMLANLAVGQQVIISGTKNADGSFLAQSIKQSTATTQIK